MIAPAKPSRRNPVPAWHTVFIKMLPAITAHARLCFRHLRPESRDEAIQGVLCNACAAVARLDPNHA